MTFETIDIEHLHVSSKHRGSGKTIPLIVGASLSLRPKEIVVVLGRSGAGKSTLLKALAGALEFEERDDYSWVVDGNVRLDSSPWSVQRRRDGSGIGLAGQDGYLYPFLSVLDNVRYGGHSRESAEAALDTVQLPAERRGVVPAGLSGGERHRVCIAKAIGRSPKLLLVDESLSQQDPLTKRMLLQDYIVPWTGKGRAALIVSHDISLVGFAAQIVVVSATGSCQGSKNVSVIARQDWENTAFSHQDSEVRAFHKVYHESLS